MLLRPLEREVVVVGEVASVRDENLRADLRALLLCGFFWLGGFLLFAFLLLGSLEAVVMMRAETWWADVLGGNMEC